MFEYAKPEQKQDSRSVAQREESKKAVTMPHQTGIPDATKKRFENLSGFSFDDVRVHYNSDKPAQLQALAYTQGNQVYVGPGQEKHLGHELGHVVQQKLGIVKETRKINGVDVNDDPTLEFKANNFIKNDYGHNNFSNTVSNDKREIVQGKFMAAHHNAEEKRLAKEEDLLIVNETIKIYADATPLSDMINNPNFNICIFIKRCEEEEDVRTSLQWDAAKKESWMLIELNIKADGTDDDIYVSLIHELTIHGLPAYQKHLKALSDGIDPYISPDGPLFDEEEKKEHDDIKNWELACKIASKYDDDILLKVMIDASEHMDSENIFKKLIDQGLKLLENGENTVSDVMELIDKALAHERAGDLIG